MSSETMWRSSGNKGVSGAPETVVCQRAVPRPFGAQTGPAPASKLPACRSTGTLHDFAMRFLSFLSLGCLLFGLSAIAFADEFQPPAEYAGQLGPYASPLKFYDGTPVTSPAEWPKRREELLRRWHEIMGPWPELIARPKIEVLETTQREGFTQRK